MQGTISRRLWAKAGAERIPLTGAFELLPICNFACKMCYVRKSRAEVEKAGGLMDGKRWLEIAEDAAKCGLLFPLLTGGEPFLYEDFQEVFAGMQDLGMQVSINSNASRIDQNMARWLGRHTPTRINITLYGASEETYQKLCGNGESFLKVKNAVQIERQHYTAECTGSGEYDFLCKRVSDTDPGCNLYVSADPPKRSNGRTK